MAIPRKLRLLLLCVGALLSCGLASSSSPIQSKTWFDQHLLKKNQALDARAHSSNERDVLITISLLDEIYDLRDYVSDPFQVDSTLAQFKDDPTLAPAVRTEAAYLFACIKGSPADSPQALNALITRSAETLSTDAEIRDAISAIMLVHHLEIPPTAEHSLEPVNSAEGWYLTSRVAGDDYHKLQALRRALELNHDYVPAMTEMAKRYAAQGQITRARSMLSATLEHYPAEISIRVMLAELDINQGRSSAALETMNQLWSRPLPIAVTRQLAEDYGQLRLLNQARELAHLAVRLHPGGSEERELALRLDEQAADANSPFLRRGLPPAVTVATRSSGETTDESSGSRGQTALRRLLNGQPVSLDDSREFFGNVSELVQKWHARPSTERSESRILADIRVDQLRPDYQAVQHVQQVIAIGSMRDVVNYKQRGIQYSAQSQQLSVVHARLHHGGGRVSEGEDLGDNTLDSSVATYDDLRTRQYRFRDLRAGDVIELEYTITPLASENPYGQYFAQLVAFGSSIPCNFQRYVLRSPREIHLSSSERSLSPAALQRRPTEDVRIWEKENIVSLVREPHSPSWSEQGAYVHISNFDSWQALGKWYANLIRPQFKLNSDLEQKVTEIVRAHSNRLDRVAAIDELVLKNTRYVALELGVYGFKPYPVTETFARRFGDCKDKASLMVALLRAAGIDADIALVRTKQLGDIIAQPASVSVFDHAIVYVPEFDLWLDGTAEFSRLRELPVDDQGVMALTVAADGDAVLRRTPASSANDNYSRRTINARVDADGTIRFSGATYVRGEDAPEVRRQLEPGESKLGYVRDRLAQVLPAVEVHDVELPLNLSDTVSLSFDGELTSFHGRRSATLPSSWMERNYVETLATKNSRAQDLILEAPWTTTEEIHVELPHGACLKGVPQNQSISSEFGNANIQYEVLGDQITILSTVKFSATLIPATQYAAFREFTAGVEAAFRRNLEVELP